MEHAVFTQKLGKSCARRESLGYIPRHTVINDDSGVALLWENDLPEFTVTCLLGFGTQGRRHPLCDIKGLVALALSVFFRCRWLLFTSVVVASRACFSQALDLGSCLCGLSWMVLSRGRINVLPFGECRASRV